MKVWLVGIAVLLLAYAFHRLASWAESRGWIYYRRRQGSSGTLGSAFLELQTMIDPSKKIVLEERRREVREGENEGGPKDPGARR